MYCVGVLTFDGGFMDSWSSRTKCVTERCEYRVSPSRAQAQRLLSVLKVITRREGGGAKCIRRQAPVICRKKSFNESSINGICATRNFVSGVRIRTVIATTSPHDSPSLEFPVFGGILVRG